MANEWHLKWLKEGVQTWNQRRKRFRFTPDLSGVRFFDMLPKDFREDTKISAKTSRYFERIDLSGANLAEADLSDLNFKKANFSDSNLRGASLARTNFSFAKFDDADLTGADFSRAILDSASFIGPIMIETKVEGASVVGTNFASVDVRFVNGRFANQTGAGVYASMSSPDAGVYASMRSLEKNLPAEYIDVHNVRTPTEVVKRVEERTKKDEYEVFYGTNRSPIFHLGKLIDFDGNESNSVSFGYCTVRIPESKPIGKSSWWRKVFNKSKLPTHVEKFIDLNPEMFWSAIGGVDFGKAPTIFVHGYNTSFRSAVTIAAEIGRNLGVSQAIGLFSWPSAASLTGHPKDETAVLNSRQALASFISKFSQNNSSGKVNIIAHSMGCRLLALTLEEISGSDRSVFSRIDNVILAAADIDQNLFSKIASKFTSDIGRTTSYACDSDVPLMLSTKLHGYDRVGYFPPVFSLPTVDSILLTGEQFDLLSHSYVSSKPAVLSDIFSLLQNKLTPSQRFALIHQGGNTWRMRA